MSAEFTLATTSSSAKKYWFLLMILPIGLAVGVVTSLVSHLRQDQKANEVVKFSQSIDLESLTDSANKMTTYIGERHLESEEGQLTMLQMASFLQGELSPQNSGLVVHKDKGFPLEGRLWYHYWVNIEGKQSNNIHLVLTNYDGPKDTGESAKIASLIALIQSLGAETPSQSIRFVFAPKAQALDALIKEARLRCLLPEENCIRTTVIQTCDNVSLDADNDWFELPQAAELASVQGESTTTLISHPTLMTGSQKDLTEHRAKALFSATAKLRETLYQAPSTASP